MSSQPSALRRAQAAATAGLNEASATVGAGADSVKNYASGSWGNPWIMLALELFIGLLFVYLIYITAFPAFDATGVIGSTKPGFFGDFHGVWLYLFALLGIVGIAGAVSLLWEKNMESFAAAFIATIVLALAFHFALQSLIDQAKVGFWFWTVMFPLLAVVIGVVAFLLWRRHQKTDEELAAIQDEQLRAALKATSDGLKERAIPMYITLAIGIISSIVAAVGLWMDSRGVNLNQ